ncbi:MAG: hypothetical protein LBD84_05670 [Campylobacteraceae bacterium]|nr:hypothetical protein [Campylobacteraceae bacterium]
MYYKLLYTSDYPVLFSIMLNSYDSPICKKVKFVFEKNPFDRYALVVNEYFPPKSAIYMNYKK